MKKTVTISGLTGALAAIAMAIAKLQHPHHATTPPPIVPSQHTMAVIVSEGDGHPLAGAAVATDPAYTYGPTNGDGYTAAVVTDGHLHVSAALAGYHGDPVDVDISANTDVRVTLTRDVPPLSAVHLDGKRLRLADGRPWNWRYATGFTILAAPSDRQDAFLEWASRRGFNGLRILVTAKLLADLPPDAGRAALPGLLEKLRARGMGAEIVPLADTGARGMSRADMRAHVAAVAVLVAGQLVPLTIELANENAHPTQQHDLQDVDFLHELRGLVPPGIPVSLGSSCCNQPDTSENYPGGDYSTPHLDRSRALWQEVARIKHLIEDFRTYVVDDEGIGAAEADQDGKRSAHPERFFAQGLLDRLGGVGSTFHFDGGLTATVPGPTQDACAAAFIEGATLVGDEDAFHFINDSGAGGITRGADWSHVFKLFGFINADPSRPSYLVALGVTGEFSATYANGWHLVRVVAEKPGVQVIEVGR